MKIRSIMIGLGLGLVAPAASAVTVNSAGAICQPAFEDDVPSVYYSSGRLGVTGDGFTEVECAVPRESGGVQMTVHVDYFFISGTQSQTCTVSVYDRDGNPHTSLNASKTGTGWQRASVTFSAAQNPAWGYTSVYCSIGNASIQILGITAAY